MKTKLLTRIMLLLCALVVGSGSVWAKQFKLVKSADQLVSGSNYLIVSVGINDKYYALSSAASNNRKTCQVTVSDDVVEVEETGTGDSVPFEITLVRNGDYWNLYDAVNKKYLNGGYVSNGGLGSAQTQLKTDASVSTTTDNGGKNGVFTIAVNTTTGVATITNQNSFTVKCNSSGTPISTYNSSQKDVCLYKEITGPASTEPIAINTTATSWNLNSSITGAFGKNGSNCRTENTLTATDGSSTITYMQGKSDELTASYLKAGGKSTFATGTDNNPRYFVLHITKSGVLTITSNSASGKQGNYLICQATTDDVDEAINTKTITTSAEQLTASGGIDIANGAYVYIGWEGTVYTESLSWAEADGITLSTTANMDGWRAFYDATQDYTLDANTKAYVVRAKSGTENVVELTKLDVTAIPHGEPVILKTSADDHKMVLTKTTGVASLGTNLLDKTDGSHNYNCYRLGYGSVGVGFYKFTTTTAPAAGIVYLDPEYINLSAGARELAISFGDDETTALTLVNNEKSIVNSEVYNLQGRRVAQPTKGLYIVNGKKVILK